MQDNGQRDDIPVEEVEDDMVLIPFKREGVKNMKCVKFTDAEIVTMDQFTEWLFTTANPATGRPFIPKKEHSGMVAFCISYTFNAMGYVAQDMARAETAEVTS